MPFINGYKPNCRIRGWIPPFVRNEIILVCDVKKGGGETAAFLRQKMIPCHSERSEESQRTIYFTLHKISLKD